MKITIHQPNFLPWLGYFNKASRVDTLVLLDQVQFSNNSYQNRTRIKTAAGPVWLTVPVLKKGKFGQRTCDVLINNQKNWAKKIVKSMSASYGRAPYFRQYRKDIEKILAGDWLKLADLNKALLDWLLRLLEIDIAVLSASELDVDGKGSDLILGICRTVGADIYLSGPSGKKYLEKEDFKKAGVEVQFYQFEHPVYAQRYGEFIPNLSIIDLIFNEGPRSKEFFKG